MTILKQMRFATKQCQNEMDIVLHVIALKKLKLGYPEKLSKKCQRLLKIELWSHIKGKFMLCGSNVTVLILGMVAK